MIIANWNKTKRRRATRRLTAFLAASTLMTVLGTIAHADPEALKPFHIPAQSLPSALALFGRQASLQVSIPAALVEGKTSQAVDGTMVPAQSLEQILSGTGLTFQISGRVVTLSKASSTIMLGPVRVGGTGDRGSPYPRDPYALAVNPPMTVGSKTPTSQREIPQSIVVITQNQIQEQSMKTLNDVMRYVPGVTVGQDDSERTTFYSRGFPISSWMIDGLPTTQNLSSIAPNLAMYDRVEVLKGPDGFMNGFGSEGGAVNLVRKRAPDRLDIKAQAYAGTYDNFGGMLDIGGSLNKAKTVRARIVGNIQSQDLMWKSSWRQDKQIYGTIEWDITRTTSFRTGAGYSYTAQKAEWTGVPAYSMPVNGRYALINLPRSAYIGAPWNHDVYPSTTVFGEMDQKIGKEWMAKLSYNYLDTQDSILNGQISSRVDNTTGAASLGDTKWHQRDIQHSVDLFASGPIHLFNRAHQLALGYMFQHENYRGINYYCGSNDSPSGDTWCTTLGSIYSSFPEPSFDGPVSDETTINTQHSIYGNLKIVITKKLKVVGGARATWFNAEFVPSARNYWQDVPSHNKISGKVTPYAGIIYDFEKHHTLYASYTTIFNSQTARDYKGDILPPLEGEQYEMGVKGSYLGGKLNTGLALFQLTEKNRPINDPRYPVGSGYSLPQGKARSRGVEMTISGNISPNWDVYGGYTYNDVQYLDSSTNANGVVFSTIAPKHVVKLYTNYRLVGVMPRLTVGAGIYVSSGLHAQDSSGYFMKQPTYETFDFRVSYKILDKLVMSMNITNAFDEHYFSSIEAGAFYGDPRHILFTLRYGQ